ncbi:MAG TPA: TIGR00730 family Rossman fold protein [Clostridiales bacterium]|nr:TIGR00730 family Rossman fold protein [Clostridiales bacterium]HPP35473.1 TIGR00730 family Rossman fold protein [Clostridiales bacterium]
MGRVICVYASSSNSIDKKYTDIAARLGEAIARNGDTFLFGGGMRGLMGAAAMAVHRFGGRVVGIIPEALNLKGVVYEMCDELVVTKSLRERKAIMDERSDAFIALPGGFGTLEELLEIITLKQLKYHNKPIVILNCDRFYDALLDQFGHIMDLNFAKPESNLLYHVTSDVEDALKYIDTYKPFVFEDKWLT